MRRAFDPMVQAAGCKTDGFLFLISRQHLKILLTPVAGTVGVSSGRQVGFGKGQLHFFFFAPVRMSLYDGHLGNCPPECPPT